MNRSDRFRSEQRFQAPPKQEYRVKEKKEDVQAKTSGIVTIGSIPVAMQDLGRKPIVIGDSAPVPVKKPVMANDHEASSSKGVKKVFQPRWCPSGLTHT